MRTTALVTISLPPALVKQSERLAKKQHMTRSELLRTALRHYLDEQHARSAVDVYKKERDLHILSPLKGSLTDLM